EAEVPRLARGRPAVRDHERGRRGLPARRRSRLDGRRRRRRARAAALASLQRLHGMGPRPGAPARAGPHALRPRELPADADGGDDPRRRRAAGRDELEMRIGRLLRNRPPAPVDGDGHEWSELKQRKQQLSQEFRARAKTATLVQPVEPLTGHLDAPTRDWIRHQVESEAYWFQQVELFPGYSSPGWDDPVENKLPYYGLPEDLTGMRVLDIGCAEGFFSFEAERRGAREVIGIDSFSDSVRRFNIVKEARQSNATAFLMNVYDLEPKRLGTFDLVLFYG